MLKDDWVEPLVLDSVLDWETEVERGDVSWVLPVWLVVEKLVTDVLDPEEIELVDKEEREEYSVELRLPA